MFKRLKRWYYQRKLEKIDEKKMDFKTTDDYYTILTELEKESVVLFKKLRS
jgi:hypothetical protein